MGLGKQIIVLVIAALCIAGLAFFWAWGSARNGDKDCGMSCSDCSNASGCAKKKE